MSMPRQSIVKVDLSSKLQRIERGALLATADKLANRMGAEVYQDGKAMTLTGYTVKGYFIRAGVDTITIAGKIDGNKAYIDLPESCYLYDGSFSCAVKLCKSGYEQTLVIFDGFIAQTITNNIIDSENVIPFMETVLKRNCYNLLDNSNFRNPVNQRGQTTYTGNGYSIDRWRAYHASTTHTVTASGIAVSATDNNPNIYQVLDPNIIDTNKTYTVAVCDSAGNVSVRTMQPTTKAYSPACIYISGSNILFRIVGANTWRWAALYEGEYTLETLPSYVPKGYAAELLECQRYFLKYTNGLANGYVTSSAKNYHMYFAIPVIMRATPTVNKFGVYIRKGQGSYAELSGSNKYTVETATVYRASVEPMVQITFSVDTAVDTNNSLLNYNFTDLELSADL